MDDGELKKIIMERESSGRISCKTACDIADETGVSRRDVGRLIDELKIKIHSCQLGCFK
jgi:DNA-binding Lrp family transcriptional regulator